MTNDKKIINVKKIVEVKKEELKLKIAKLKNNGINPKICVIVANKEESSRIYVNNKKKICEELGILYEDYFLDENVSDNEILGLIEKLNNDISVNAILLQLPLYEHLDERKIINKISYRKDVDGLTSINLGKLFVGEECIIACTPKGIITILENVIQNFEGKHAVIIGRSNIVGKPIAQLLLNKNCTVTMCHSKTKDISKYTKEADILIVATGIPRYITGDMVKKDSIIIDVGINRVDGKVIGDVDTESVSNISKYVTKVPGGVGLTTVLSLVENVVEIASKE